MSSISEFLRARYTERRVIAVAAGGDRIEAVPLYEGVSYLTMRGDHPDRYTGEVPATLANHVAANDPAAILADLDAKLAIIDEHQDVNEGDCGTCVDGRWGYPTHGGSSPQRFPCRTLRFLAVPFAAHPDYDERWRP